MMSLAIPPTLPLDLAVFALVFIRLSGIFLIAPFYGGPGIPTRLKLGLTFFLAACLAPLIPEQAPAAALSLSQPLAAVLTVAGELSVGFALGLAGAAVMGAVQTAGHLISQDIGLTIANVIDPITSAQVSVIGQIKVALALFIFIGLDFHHGLLRALAGSLRLLPLGGVAERLMAPGGAARLGGVAISQGSWMFESAVRLGLPVAVVLFLVTVTMGLLARAVPEMNVFIIGFGIRVLVGLWVMVLSVPYLARAFQALFERAARESATALRALAGS